jgi:homoserine O-succinyltransferase
MTRIEQFALGGTGRRDWRGAIRIGLVNNMPDAAMRATELQFARLLKDAAGALDVRLQLFSLAGLARGEAARARMEGFYADAAGVAEAGLDALIVTDMAGAGPLKKSPLWPQLTRLIDWAATHPVSAMFSGRAAEAAVLHLDGIAARPLPLPLAGVFEVERVNDDPLFFHMNPLTRVPHARTSEIAESDLAAARGYSVLSRIPYGGVDLFARAKETGEGRLLFFQGHPEYGPQTLGRVFLDDMRRFLAGEGPRPAIPGNYFDRATEDRIAELAARATDERAMSAFTETVTGALPLESWHGHTLRLFGNWLTLVAAEKTRRGLSRPAADRRKVRA